MNRDRSDMIKKTEVLVKVFIAKLGEEVGADPFALGSHAIAVRVR